MIATKTWGRAFVVKKLKDRDFSGLLETCSGIVHLYDTEHEMPENTLELQQDLMLFLSKFKPDEDVLVIAGSAVSCAVALQILISWHRDVSIAVYKDGKYEYFCAESTWEGDFNLAFLKGA